MLRDINKSEIEKQAKEILDKFAIALEKFEKEGLKEETEGYVDRKEFEREEKNREFCNSEFKKRFLENAPFHNDDFIIGEKGDWK